LRVAASTLAKRTAYGVSRKSLISSFKGGASTISFPQAEFHASARREEEVKPVDSEVVEADKGWWDNVYMIPIGFTLAIPAIHFDWLIVNEETQLAGVFITFCAIAYSQTGDMIHKGMVEQADKMLAEQNALEDELIESLEELHKDMEELSGNNFADYEAINTLTDETYVKLNAAGAIKPQYDFKAQVERTLNMIQQEEANVMEKAKVALMEEATASVSKQFSSSKKLQKAAMDLAIAKINGTAKPENDPVKGAFVKFFKDKAASSTEEDASELTAQREALVAKLNAVASNEGFFFKFDSNGQPKMTV